MNPFRLLKGVFYALKLIGLNEEYKTVTQMETNKHIKKARLSDIDHKAKKYEAKLKSLSGGRVNG